MKTHFHLALKRFLIEAFSSPALQPHAVVEKLSKSIRRPCGKNVREEISKILSFRSIDRIVHFTPLNNVRQVMQFGLIPREYLELEVVRLALGPTFPDELRLDTTPHYNCLSLTHPNYKMFFAKRRASHSTRWAVLEFSSDILLKLWSECCPTNSASGAPVLEGAIGMQSMFIFQNLREELRLSTNMTTDPQAEVLCDSALSASEVKHVWVEHESDLAYLANQGIHAELDTKLFGPRHDFKFWSTRRITDLPEFSMELDQLRGMNRG